jgi:aminoglycoside phosphotransferase (APT) family kinase protein
MPMDGAFRALSLAEATRQQAAGTAGEVQSFIEPGWSAVRGQRPELHALVAPLLADWSPLVSALQQLPSYFQHGDWKMGNLGRHPDGRVVLLDWDRPYLGPPTGDLAWYLAVNCDRLPESKEDTIARHREALRRCGADVSGWYDDALTLSLLGAFLQLGWSKAGQPEELDWWSAPVEQGVRMLGLPT